MTRERCCGARTGGFTRGIALGSGVFPNIMCKHGGILKYFQKSDKATRAALSLPTAARPRETHHGA